MADFTKLENIYHMFSTIEELAAEKINKASADDSTSLVRRLINILVESSVGAYSVQELQQKLDDLRTSNNDSEGKKLFNRLVSFYSTLNDGKGLHAEGCVGPYIFKEDDDKTPIRFHEIVGMNEDDFSKLTTAKGKNVSVCLSRNAYVSPLLRDVNKVELFLNYIPSIVLSSCSPYLELEFVFDRPGDQAGFLASPSLLKFLLGGKKLKADGTTADDLMYRGRYSEGSESSDELDASGNVVQKKTPRSFTSAGMELFTSPQTLINMEPNQSSERYMPVLDPTRPLATLETVTINVKGTTGIMSFKTAQVGLKLHDRTRLAEFADVLQPGAETRTTVWLTYGWRHMENKNSTREVQAYGEFINKYMLMKEAYGITNSSFSFDASGQVSVTLELYTKSGSELRNITTSEDSGLTKIKLEQARLAANISRIRTELKLDPPEGSKEILGYTLIGAAAGNTFADVEPQKAQKAINDLNNILNSSAKDTQSDPRTKEQIKVLIDDLSRYYKTSGKNAKTFTYSDSIKARADSIVETKLNELRRGKDPFLMTSSKWDVMKDEGGYGGVQHPHIEQLINYNSKYTEKR